MTIYMPPKIMPKCKKSHMPAKKKIFRNIIVGSDPLFTDHTLTQKD